MVKLRDGRHFDRMKQDDRYKYNVYVCERGHQNLSCDIDEGVTPMFLMCRRGVPACGAQSESSMYPSGRIPFNLFPVKVVWRHPTKEEMRIARRDGYADHYEKGGLHMEWIT